MLTTIEHRIHWLTLTRVDFPETYEVKSYADMLERAEYCHAQLTGETPLFAIAKAVPHYAYGVRDMKTGICYYASERAEQGVMAQLTGETCDRNPDILLDLLVVAAQQEYRVTRIDVAFDIFFSPVTASDVADWFAAFCGGSRLKSNLKRGKDGDTFYVGSRMSEAMLRIYDKDAEQRTAVPWLRIELEAHGGYAQFLISQPYFLVSQAATRILRMLPGDFKPLSVALLNVYLDPEQDTVYASTHEKSDKRLWIEKQVEPSLKQLAVDDPDYIDSLISALTTWRTNADFDGVVFKGE